MSPDRFKFEDAHYPPEAFDYHTHMANGFTKAQAKRAVRHFIEQRALRSDTYQVAVTSQDSPVGPLTVLSIKRNDKQPIGDWREKQAIKNAVVGPEREACELFPAESRLVDTANQYWLYVLPEGACFPFGFGTRTVMDAHEVEGIGAVQRPLNATGMHTQ